jgi:hypothetical protein
VGTDQLISETGKAKFILDVVFTFTARKTAVSNNWQREEKTHENCAQSRMRWHIYPLRIVFKRKGMIGCPTKIEDDASLCFVLQSDEDVRNYSTSIFFERTEFIAFVPDPCA